MGIIVWRHFDVAFISNPQAVLVIPDNHLSDLLGPPQSWVLRGWVDLRQYIAYSSHYLVIPSTKIRLNVGCVIVRYEARNRFIKSISPCVSYYDHWLSVVV